MKRKTSTIPTKIYTYGCTAPRNGADLVEDQFRRAHRYRNALVEIDRRRREGIARVQAEHDMLGPLIEAIDAQEAWLAGTRAEAKATRSGRGNSELQAWLKDLTLQIRADLAVLYWLRGWAKAILRVDDAMSAWYEMPMTTSPHQARFVRPWQRLAMAIVAREMNHPGVRLACDYAAVEDAANEEKRAARGASGLTCGTYLTVEKAAEEWRKSYDPPRFLR